MKKLCLLLSAICLLSAPFAVGTARAEGGRTVLQCAYGRVISADGLDKVILSGVDTADSVYTKDIAVTVRGKEKTLEISPAVNGGYNPHIQLVSFDGVKDQIFYGADSGGSGGFGFYYVYDVKNGGAVTLFDAENFPVPYEARYADFYRVEVKNTVTGARTYIDISQKGEEYLSELYYPDGKLKAPLAADVSPVNAASPFYLNGEKRYGLEIYYRITGRYSADGIGNIVVRMTLEDGAFLPFYDVVGGTLTV